jgi:hypothetical protein
MVRKNNQCFELFCSREPEDCFIPDKERFIGEYEREVSLDVCCGLCKLWSVCRIVCSKHRERVMRRE